MTEYISVDVSEFQPVVTDAYPHRWLAFRICDGSYVDGHAPANLAWAVYARKAGKLDGFTVYVVFRPGMNGAILSTLDALLVPRDCYVMVDVESWAGQISGNHSTEITALVNQLTVRQANNSHVWVYGNDSDLAAIYPNRPPWLSLVIAAWGGVKPSRPKLAGWQYTDGAHPALAGYPTSSPPFGACDHDVFYLDGAAPDSGGNTPLMEDEDMPILYLDAAKQGVPLLVVGRLVITVGDSATVSDHKKAGYPIRTLGHHDYLRARKKADT